MREGLDGKITPGAPNPGYTPGGIDLRGGGLGAHHWLPFPQEGQGVDKTPRGRNLHIDYQTAGAHAWLKFRHLISSPQTAKLQAVRLSVPRPQPQGGPHAVVWTNRPALQLPQYRLTGKPDAEVYAEAKARALARMSRPKGR